MQIDHGDENVCSEGSSTEETTDRLLPVIEEEVKILKAKIVTGKVIVTKKIHEREELVTAPVTDNSVEIKRVSINAIVEGPQETRREGDTIIFPVVEETLVVTKQYVLREEVRVTYRTTESLREQRVTLRKEELVIDRERRVGD